MAPSVFFRNQISDVADVSSKKTFGKERIVISRRDFLKAASAMAGLIGLEASGMLKLQQALAAAGSPPVIWLQGQSCSGCSVSFLNSVHYATADDILLNSIDLQYHPTIMAVTSPRPVRR